MKEYLKKIPQELQDLIASAHKIAALRGVPMYLVGGFVRDLLLGVKNLDLDIVAEADAIECARHFASMRRARLLCHPRFGTATVIDRHLKVDFATARNERYPAPGCLPQVAPGTLQDDLARRDFTINAMAISIGPHNYGQLIDHCCARQDLKKGLVRVLHPLSFIDDPTRILRAVRFEQRYGFKLEKETLKFLRDAVWLKMLEKVQPQRIRDELLLLLKEEKPMPALKRLSALAGFRFIDKKLTGSQEAVRLCGLLEPHIHWFKKVYVSRRSLDEWVMYCMALCDGLSLARAKAVCGRFMFLKGAQKRILEYKAIKPGLIISLSDRDIVPSKAYTLLEPLSYEAILMLRAKFPNAVVRRTIDDFLTHYSGTRIHTTGQDLMRLGLTPGPQFQKILKAVLDARLDGKVSTKQEELAWAQSRIKAR